MATLDQRLSKENLMKLTKQLFSIVLFTIANGAAVAQTSPIEVLGKPGTTQYNQRLNASLMQLQKLSDEDSLRKLLYNYGRGNDVMSINYADRVKGRKLASDEYAKAFAPDTRVEVFALGGTTPISTTVGVAPWADFVDKYYSGTGYSSTVHLMSNFSIDFADANTANVSAYTIAPHFFVNAAAKDKASADTTAEWMRCRYSFEAKRMPDGSWKMSKLQIHLEEIWRSAGFYAGGQAKGQ
jgi:SnoaL-like domain